MFSGKGVAIYVRHPSQQHMHGPLLTEYFMAYRERGIREVRVIHGQGIGDLRRTEHVLLVRMPDVDRYALAFKPCDERDAAGREPRRRSLFTAV